LACSRSAIKLGSLNQQVRTSEILPDLLSRFSGRRGFWGTITRGVWLALLCTVVVFFVFGAPILWSQLQAECSGGGACPQDPSSVWLPQSRAALGLTAAQVATYFVTLDALGVVGYALVGGLLMWRRPDDRMAVLAAFGLLLFGGVTTCDSVRALASSVPVLSGIVRGLAAFGAVGVAICFCVFPDGRFVPRWSIGVAILLVLAATANTVAPGSPPDVFNWSRLGVLLYVAVIVCAQLYRYHRISSFTQRQQTKWIVLGLAVTGVVYAAYVIGIDFLQEGLPVDGSPVVAVIQLGVFVPLAFGLLMLPASIGLAILQHRLFDIDLVINRTLVYGSVTVILVGVFLAVTALAQSAMEAATGYRSDLLPPVIGVLVALGFHPLRQRARLLADAVLPARQELVLLFTDIVGSTDRLAAVGDAAWREVLDRYRANVRRELRRHGGREMHIAGDSFFATFDHPVRALRCAQAARVARAGRWCPRCARWAFRADLDCTGARAKCGARR
jgi:hypothetical protein